MFGIDFFSKIFGKFNQIKVRSESAGQSLGLIFLILGLQIFFSKYYGRRREKNKNKNY